MPSSVKGNNEEYDSVDQPAMCLTHILSGRKIPAGESTFGNQYHSRAGPWKALYTGCHHSHSPSQGKHGGSELPSSEVPVIWEP